MIKKKDLNSNRIKFSESRKKVRYRVLLKKDNMKQKKDIIDDDLNGYDGLIIYLESFIRSLIFFISINGQRIKLFQILSK